jgi:TonB family protein
LFYRRQPVYLPKRAQRTLAARVLPQSMQKERGIKVPNIQANSPHGVDRIWSIAPDYPYSERARRHSGSGYFQVTLDTKTGAVTKVAVRNSTGFPTLDNCAVAALRQWRWKPGKWREVEDARYV